MKYSAAKHNLTSPRLNIMVGQHDGTATTVKLGEEQGAAEVQVFDLADIPADMAAKEYSVLIPNLTEGLAR